MKSLLRKVPPLLLFFCLSQTLFAKDAAVHFFIFGDWGSGTPEQRAVAQQMKEFCDAKRCDFGLTLGDNFYFWGVKSVNDPQWKTKFKDLYGDLNVPIYAVLGNHDVFGNEQAQIEYSKIDPQWKMPGYHYSVRYPTEGPPLVEIFVLNSNDFNRASQEWLKHSLEASQAVWKMVAFHHPILDNGKRHPPDQKAMYPKLEPIICRKIPLILSGHEHIFSHLKDPKSEACGWEQLIVGTGGRKLDGVKKILPEGYQVLYTESRHGFGFFEATEKELKFYFIRADGSLPYQYLWKK